jgi:8-oxo-dGTP pyrophosphatase MutT (NUDIX family)
MQMRFDGKLGFTGGIIEVDDKSPEIGVGREMLEEMGVDPKRFPLSKDNLIMTQSFNCDTLPQVKTLYFYALEVKEEEILEIEKNARQAVHFGEEVMPFILRQFFLMFLF